MRIHLTSAGSGSDISVTLPDGSLTLTALLESAGVTAPDGNVVVDGRVVRPHEPVGGLGLHEGSQIDLNPVPPVSGRPVDLIEVAGLAAGNRTPLAVGMHDLGLGDDTGQIAAPDVRLTVEQTGAVVVSPIGRGGLRVDGMEVNGAALEPVCDGRLHVSTGGGVFRIASRVDEPRRGQAGAAGRVRYLRTPRMAPPSLPEQPAAPARPAQPRAATPLPWAMVLAPIPIAAAMALVYNPYFLAFAAFTPLLSLARWLEGRWRAKRDTRKAEREWSHALEEYEQALREHAAHVAALRRARIPDVAAVLETARVGGPGLWGRCPGQTDYLCTTVGYGDVAGDWELGRADPEATELARRWRWLVDVPIDVDFDAHRGVGFIGDSTVWRLAATAVIQLAATHGPASLELGVVCDEDRLDRWDWMKWLPHLQETSGWERVATSLADIPRVTEPSATATASTAGARPRTAEAPPPGPVRIIVIDSPAMLDAVLARCASRRTMESTRLCVIGESADRLPSACTAVAHLRANLLTLSDLAIPLTLTGLLPVSAPSAIVAELARALARFVDPDAQASGAALAESVDLGFLLGGRLDAAQLGRWWDTARPDLAAVLGATADGPLEVDLIRDGPHSLVAGTTGSGKSELLRTLVASLACRYPPDQVNFVLIDFKGGGAFDVCTDLPHTVGVVTDLDDPLAARALRCLRAELGHRERVLRAAGVNDMRDMTGVNRPARLVLVIDEFATLAAELPDFMTSLVDIAQRGRSLGIHLVLATQRPTGVVDAKIRANTNLRIALRVQSDSDSQDVIGSPAATQIDRRRPGRGLALLGPGELTAFQTAYVSAATPVGPQVVRIDCFRLGSRPAPSPPVGLQTTDPSDLQRIIDSSRRLAAGMPRPRVPWPDPLPDRVDAEPLWDRASDGASHVCLGLVDRPDEQRVEQHCWDPTQGSLLAYGLDPHATCGVIVTACAALTRRHTADRLHVYLLDFMPTNGIDRIASLPHVAARVSLADHERLIRVIERLEHELTARVLAVRSDPAAAAAWPLIVLGISGYHLLLAAAEELGRLDLAGRVERLVTDGPQLGLVTIATTHHERGIPNRLAGQVKHKLIFQLADSASYTQFGLRAREVPDLHGNRAVDLPSGCEVVVATPSVIESAGGGMSGPPPVGVLAERLHAGELDTRSYVDGSTWHLAVGQRHSDLASAVVALPAATHFVISGGPGAGRTTALKTLVGSLREAAPTTMVSVLTTRPSEWAEPVGAEHLDGSGTSPTLVVIDGLDAAVECEHLLNGLVGTADVRLVVADRPDAFRLPPPWLRQVLGARSGLLLRPQPDHGDLLRARLPMRGPVVHPAGRAYLVSGGFAELVQVALPSDAAIRVPDQGGAGS